MSFTAMKMSFGGSEMSFGDWKMSFFSVQSCSYTNVFIFVDHICKSSQILTNTCKNPAKNEFLGLLKWVSLFLKWVLPFLKWVSAFFSKWVSAKSHKKSLFSCSSSGRVPEVRGNTRRFKNPAKIAPNSKLNTVWQDGPHYLLRRPEPGGPVLVHYHTGKSN